MTETLSLAILAGGRALRLGGRMKPLAQLDGETLVARILRVLGPPTQEQFLVAPAHLSEYLAEFALVVEDSGEGPGRAVHTAAKMARGAWLLVVGGDHVAPSIELVQRLWAARSASDAVVCRVDGQLQPTYALYRTAAVRQFPEPGPRSLHALLDHLSVHVVEDRALTAVERAALQDVDTHDDVARWGVALPAPKE